MGKRSLPDPPLDAKTSTQRAPYNLTSRNTLWVDTIMAPINKGVQSTLSYPLQLGLSYNLGTYASNEYDLEKPLPLFYTVMDTVMCLSNAYLYYHQTTQPHNLDSQAEAVVRPIPPLLQPDLVKLHRDLHLQLRNERPLAYVEIFVDGFSGLSQGYTHSRHHVRLTLSHTL